MSKLVILGEPIESSFQNRDNYSARLYLTFEFNFNSLTCHLCHRSYCPLELLREQTCLYHKHVYLSFYDPSRIATGYTTGIRYIVSDADINSQCISSVTVVVIFCKSPPLPLLCHVPMRHWGAPFIPSPILIICF